MRGVIVRLVPAQGFGFIRTGDGEEFFFHLTGVKTDEFSELAEGSDAEFSIGEESSGDKPGEHRRGVNVHLAPEELPAVDNEPLPPEKTGKGTH